jgi:signal transduction histidine kinase/AmiR/NasT family two-component response regulator
MPQTVLIADGKTARRKRLSKLVSGLGYRVVEAGDAAEAFKQIQASPPQVVLTGSGFPDRDVDVLVREIKRTFRDVEILVRPDEPWVIEDLKEFVAGFLTKPLNPHLVEVQIRRACERAVQRRRLREMPQEITRRVEGKVTERLETERFLTVKQIVDKLSAFIGQIARDVEGGVRYFNEIPYFVAIHDRRGCVLAANRSYRLLLGGRAGDASCLVYEGRSGSSDECPAGRTLRTGNAQESREVVRYRSGVRVPVIVHTAPIYNNDGRVDLVLEVSAGTQDVAKLRDELHSTQQRYQLLFDAVPCYVVGLDPDLCVTTANRLFTDEFGDKTGAGFREVFLIDDDVFAESPIQKTLKEGRSLHGEVALTGPNGRHYNMLVWTSPMSTAAGKLMQVLVIFMDITQVRELQSNLASLGLMVSSISHSIKGVLTGLDAGLYLLNKGLTGRDDAQVQSGVEIVRSIAARIRKMVMDILFCAKERELQRECVDIRRFAEDVVQTVRPLFAGKGVELACEFESELGVFEVDPGMLKSALINLLENAADACAAEGTGNSCRTVFGLEANADAVGILVEDNGTGMTAEQLKNLFTVFFSTKGSKGTGLGLFITDTIVRQHGGTIAVDSAVGRGTRFGIMIPRRAPKGEGKEHRA